MPDHVDIASDYADDFTANAVAQRVRYEGESRTHCIDCEEEIPQRRRESIVGVERCVDCQSMQEQGAR